MVRHARGDLGNARKTRRPSRARFLDRTHEVTRNLSVARDTPGRLPFEHQWAGDPLAVYNNTRQPWNFAPAMG